MRWRRAAVLLAVVVFYGLVAVLVTTPEVPDGRNVSVDADGNWHE